LRSPFFSKSRFSKFEEVTMHGTRLRYLQTGSFAVAGALILVVITAGRILAQDSGMLAGTVSSSEKRPLPHARISVVGTSLAALADTDGTFHISAPPLGAQSVEVRLLGYEAMLIPVRIESGKVSHVEVMLAAIPVPLQTVKVTADTLLLPEMRRFAERRARGSGRFFTREDIDRMEARVFTDILRRVPGMQIEPSEGAFGQTYSAQTSRNQGTNGARSCPVLFLLNGVPLASGGNVAINHFVSPGEVAAVEVYSGASQIPSEFNSIGSTARCGVVVIWTRISTSPSRSN
jgi:hypothetical protein